MSTYRASSTRKAKTGAAAAATVDPPPIFITGMPRSGTTLVSMLLNAHSRVAIAPETHYFRKYVQKGNRRRCLSTPAAFERFAHFFLSGAEIRAFHFTDREKKDLRQAILSEDRTHASVLEAVLSTYAGKHGKTIWGEKTPDHVYYIEELLKTFPHGRIIVVLRDPRDIGLSLRKVGWHRGNLIQHLTEWKRVVRIARAVRQRHPDKIYVIRYEDLLSRTVETTEALCDFLEIGYEPEMVEYHRVAVPNFDVSSEPWKAKNLRPLDTTNRMKWRDEMTPDECAVADRLAGDELVQMGYKPSGCSVTTKTWFLLATLYIENAILSAKFWTNAAYLRLRSRY